MTDAAEPLRQAQALLAQRRPAAATRVLDGAAGVLRAAPAWALLRGVAHTRLGRIDAAAAVLRPLLAAPEPWRTEATAALADAWHFAGRHDEVQQLLQQCSAWAASPRGQLFDARVHAAADPEQALHGLLGIVRDQPGSALARIAGFDAVKLLDRLARYREAFELATELHASEPAFDQAGFLAGVVLQQRLLAKGNAWCPPRAQPVDDAAFIVGLPRSGTTLVEQMLDAHPAIAGIGEHEGIGDVADALVAAGVWPYRLAHLGAEAAQAIQSHYLQSARHVAGGAEGVAPAGADVLLEGAEDRAVHPRLTLDKSLLTWRWLPALAAVLPGAVALHVQRDARDVAISAFLSYFDASAFGWTASLPRLRQVIAAERALVPLALHTLSIPHETLGYEALVADPEPALARVLQRLGLPMHEAVLRPEHNARTAVTLSHAQVRQGLNDRSIGRWRHYAFAFDADDPAAWAALA